MRKRDGVKKTRLPKWRVQGRFCLRCAKVYLPNHKLQECCMDCSVLISLGMSEIGTTAIAKR